MSSSDNTEEKGRTSETSDSRTINVKEETVAAALVTESESAVAIASIEMSKAQPASASSTKRKDKQYKQWTAKEDEALMIAVLEERNESEDEEEEEEEEDWQIINWDVISEQVPNRTAVECLQRYMKHKKNNEAARRTSSEANVGSTLPVDKVINDERKAAAKRNISTVRESEEISISSPRKKTKELAHWTEDETNLLTSLAEHYQDCKCHDCP